MVSQFQASQTLHNLEILPSRWSPRVAGRQRFLGVTYLLVGRNVTWLSSFLRKCQVRTEDWVKWRSLPPQAILHLFMICNTYAVGDQSQGIAVCRWPDLVIRSWVRFVYTCLVLGSTVFLMQIFQDRLAWSTMVCLQCEMTGILLVVMTERHPLGISK